ncbi:MAG: hypothetical protein LBB82_07500 [Treponema sp.]|jgi:hypothetical protein|nr:hypothetical protein [Treponema sp.]
MKNFVCVFLIVSAALAVVACGSAPTPAAAAPAAPVPSGDLILDGAAAYTTIGGDCLSSVAARVYGNKFYFPIIQKASGITTDPDVISIGLKLTLVDLPRNLRDAGAKAKIKQYIADAAATYNNRDSAIARQMQSFASGL